MSYSNACSSSVPSIKGIRKKKNSLKGPFSIALLHLGNVIAWCYALRVCAHLAEAQRYYARFERLSKLILDSVTVRTSTASPPAVA